MDNITFTVNADNIRNLKKDIEFVNRQMEFAKGSHEFAVQQYNNICKRVLLLVEPSPKKWDMDDYDIAYTQTVAYTNSKSPAGRYNECFPLLKRILDSGGVKWIIWPEYTIMGQVHFHGAFKILDECKYHKMICKLKSQFGRLLCKYMDNTQVWSDYCSKSQPAIERLLKITLPKVSQDN